MKYVVDASVAVKWYVPEVHSMEAERLLDPANELHAPDLIVPEFGSILWKKIGRGELTAAQARKIIEAFIGVPMFKYPASPLLEAAFAGALQTAQTVYDWTYLALAVTLDCQMVTADEKFYLALRGGALVKHLCRVADIPHN
jgi:predicted nucleic acid-binding protein